VLWIFITFKNPLSSGGFWPVNLGFSGKHASIRPPRVTVTAVCYVFLLLLTLELFSVGTGVSSPCSARVRNTWTFTLLPYVIVVCCIGMLSALPLLIELCIYKYRIFVI
jgi:hypothetical protein